ncbi:unnamed protein product, partial [Ectocarpus sp. 12 AP-2014]
DGVLDLNRLLKYLGENKITRMLFTPSLLQLVLDQCEPQDLKECMKTMRIVWLCGEVVTIELRNKFKALLPDCHMENLYSISECHDISFCNLDQVDVNESPKYAPCGKVVPNVRAYILDEQLQHVPVGVPGRMWIAGPTLAIGYLNMPERTAERFVPDPFAEAAGKEGERMYDTGDRCRYLPSGSIEVIGRCDFMVKVRGYSVVIGAVEAAITEHPLVSTAIVMTEGAEGSMDKKLVAYIVPDSWDKLPSASSIKRFLKSRLPPYAVPHVCILLDAIPINMASGKADKKKLPKTGHAEVRFAPYSCAHDDQYAEDGGDAVLPAGDTKDQAPTKPSPSSLLMAEEKEEHAPDVPVLTSTQRSVARLWARLLKVDQATITPSSDFFELGGHSLLLAKLSAGLLKDMAAEVSIPSIIESPTLGELSEKLDSEMTASKEMGEGGGGGGGDRAAAILSTPALRAVGKAWASVLEAGCESSFSPKADFFDLGGHSLLLAKLATSLSREAGVTVTIPQLIERPSMEGMAKIVEELSGTIPGKPSIVPGLQAAGISNSQAAAPVVLHDGSRGVVQAFEGVEAPTATAAAVKVVDLEAEASRLDASIYPAGTRKIGYSRFRASKASRPPQRVLLTGATGFLGVHILASLLRDTHVDVFCLVRAGNEEEALQRLEDTLTMYKLDNEEVLSGMDRVMAVPGDLSRPLLGLDDMSFKASEETHHKLLIMLAAELDSIIHSGASVNLVRSYQSLKAVNVLGTQEVLRLAVTNAFGTRVKPVHFVSTNGVFPFSSETKTFMEDADMREQWKELSDGYGQSKWVAEQMCLQARSRGLPVSILRPGNMSPSATTGAWNPSDFIYMLLQGCLDLGCVPEGVAWQIDVTPVDFAARAIVHVAVDQPSKGLGQVLHIQNPGKPQTFENVAAWLKEATGAQLEGVSMNDFRRRLGKAVEQMGPKDGGVLAQLESGLDGFAYYLADPAMLDCAGLTAALEESGIDCPSLGKDLVSVYASSLAVGRE